MPTRAHSHGRSGAPTFADLVRHRGEHQPDRSAYAFLLDGERQVADLTYAQLDARARRLAARLQAAGAAGERVLLLLPPGLEYVVAVFATLMAGGVLVPAYPVRPGRSTTAVGAIARDAQARFAIASGSGKSRLALEGLTWLEPDDDEGIHADAWKPARIRPGTLAMIQYTSGSTSRPRGAAMSHEHLMVATQATRDVVGNTPDDVGMSWLPPYHDMGLFGGILLPMLTGGPVTLMAPLAFLQRPARWIEAISRIGATISGGPNFAYDMSAEAFRPEDVARLDLSRWRVASNGAEPVRPDTLERFSATFAPAGFRRTSFVPMYGLAEAMLVSARQPGSGHTEQAFDREALGRSEIRPAAGAPARTLVGNGQVTAGLDVRIVDPASLQEAGPDAVGEIWVSGRSVAPRYWRHPAETRRTLGARLHGVEGRFLRTGDLGFLSQGELFITGRLKEMLLIRGRNHYPVDLERTVEESHPAIRRGGVAAVGLMIADEERLAVVAELRRSAQAGPDEVLAAIRSSVAEAHELRPSRVVLLGEGRLPRTSSGKTQRVAIAAALASGELTGIADWRDGQFGEPAVIATAPEALQGSAGPAMLPPVERRSAREIETWVVAHLAGRLHVDPESLDRAAPFASFGLGSVEATALAGELATWLGRPLSPTLTWEYPTVERLALHLSGDPADEPDEFLAAPQEPIAIIGLGVRFPGAHDLDAFRDLLRAGGDAVGEAPPGRLPLDELYDPNPATPGKVVSRNGGFLDDVELFDSQFFGISPREASRMDPQQRLLLEVTEEALEHAALPAKRLAGTATGVFVGIGNFEYGNLQIASGADRTLIDAYHGTGVAHSIAANRVSFLYDLRGPSLALDTACSSSLVAVHLACQSLLTHESDLALAGGVNVILTPDATVAFSQARMLSPHGHSRSFDASADGYVRSEGAGMVVLKRLTDARRDGDRVIALIRGTAVNQDGLTSGITAPNGRAQQEVTRLALARAGIAPAQLGAIEAHGTGTPLGDPIEVNALAEVIGPAGEGERPVWLGSVKANVGHLEVASGMAGLAKAVLQLSYGEIYPQIHFDTLNPHIRIEGTPLQIPSKLEPWPLGPEPRYIGISSFGFGGTNAHVVLEESREPIAPRSAVERPLHLVALSAKTETALHELARRTIGHLDRYPDVPIEDVAHTANAGRTRHLQSAIVLAGDRVQLRDRLAAVAAGKGGPGVTMGRRATHAPPVAFLFTGQGAQYAGMGRGLYATQPTFRDALDRASELIDPHLDRPLRSLLFPADGGSDLLGETTYTQPALFALGYALAELWKSWGVTPDVVLGHSVGEYTAACVAGALSLEDAAQLIAVRGRLMGRLPRDGAMAAVLAPLATVEAALAAEPDVVVAGVNAPDNVTISGRRDALARVVDSLEADAVSVVPLKVSHAFHSALMEPMLDAFEALAARVEQRPLKIALTSNLTGQLLGPGATLDAHYWREHARHAVLFAADVKAAHEFGAQIFLEIGPTPTLLGLARRSLSGVKATWAPSLRSGEDDWQTILSSVAMIHSAGRDIDWVGFDRDYRRRIVTLPSYPFERARHWFAAVDGVGMSGAGAPTADRGHGLVRTVLGTPHPIVQARISDTNPAWLGDHRIQGTVVAPAALFLETMLAAAPRGAEGVQATIALDDVEFARALFLGSAPHVIQAIVSSPGLDGRAIQLYGRPEAAADDWTLHAAGRLGAAGAPLPGDEASAVGQERVAAARDRCTTQIEPDDFYRLLSERGLEYGPSFRAIRTLQRRSGEAVALVAAPEGVAADMAKYHVHPALLDAALQTFAASLPDSEASGGTYLPVGVARLRFHGRPGERFWVIATASGAGGDAALTREGDLWIVNEDGSPVAEILGLRVQQLEPQGPAARAESVADWLYEIAWEPIEAPVDAPQVTGTWLVLAGTDEAGNLASRLGDAGTAVHVVVPGEAFAERPDGGFEARVGFGEDVVEICRRLGARGESVDVIVSLLPLEAGTSRAFTAALSPAHRNGNRTKNGNGRARAATQNDELEAVAAPTLAALHLVQALAKEAGPRSPKVVFVTRGAAAGLHGSTGDVSSLPQAAVVGFARTARMEHPELRIGLVDLDPSGTPDPEPLRRALTASSTEPEVAIRGTELFARRLERAAAARDGNGASASQAGEDHARGDADVMEPSGLLAPGGPYRLEAATPGILDTLRLRPATRRAPGPGEVELEVQAAGVNFRDVMKALGIYPHAPGDVMWLGDELAGRVIAVGKDVGLQVGDEVFGVAPAAFGNVATTRAEFVIRRPADLSAEDAATLPIVFSTALHALRDLARLQGGERVLIHAAAGGVGQAAIQIAHSLGAEVYATASEGKRDVVRGLGVEHVFDSRSLDFVSGIRDATAGRGVDVVLNSLAGDYIGASLNALAPYGRFVEIGKRDIFANAKLGLWPFRNNLSFFAVDMDRVFRDRPGTAAALLEDVRRGLEDGRFRPLSRTTFPIGSAVRAFRLLQSGRHVGKVVLSFAEAPQAADPGLDGSSVGGPMAFQPDATYLITGGLRGLGARVAEWMATAGARNLVLVGRDPTSDAARQTARRVEALGARATLLAADTARSDQVAAVLEHVRAALPPLRGIVHAAGVIADASLLNLTDDAVRRVLGPKAAGAISLHRATLDLDLDFFVSFSSMSSVMGNPGQANYSAANAVLDGLAWLRESQGRAGQTINWGPWAEIGMSAAADGQRIFGLGIGAIQPDDGIAALEHVLGTRRPQVLVQRVDWPRFVATVPGAGADPFLTRIRSGLASQPGFGSGPEAGATLVALLDAPADERQDMLERFVQAQLAKVLQMEPDDLPLDQPLNTVGLDSLMALELKNRVEVSLSVTLPIVNLIQGPTISQLAEDLLARVEASTAGRDSTSVASADPGSAPGEGAPSAEEVASLLSRSTGSKPRVDA